MTDPKPTPLTDAILPTTHQELINHARGLERKLSIAVKALHGISLGAQNSMHNKEALGREARRALAQIKGGDDE